MVRSIFAPEITDTFKNIQQAARDRSSKTVLVDGESITIPYPFPSPEDWRDGWIYFLMIDRFNHPINPPKSKWNDIYDFRQGGNFKGIQQQLPYIASLGATAIWISPVLKNSKPDWPFNYHGYAPQDFLNLDGRFASDGTPETAERELTALIDEAHARGMYVILDIVINHASRIFDYVYNGMITPAFSDQKLLDSHIGGEPPVLWINGFGWPRNDWQDELPDADALSRDDAVWPIELQRKDFFRRRGSLISNAVGDLGFVHGDFDTMRQLVLEYNASLFPSQADLLKKFGDRPVLSLLVVIYQYLIAKFDIDGFRLDTVKYIDPGMVETFGNAVREFALSIGKKNFFTFGEIYDSEDTIANFVGRNSRDTDGYGIDAALDFPLFYTLPEVIKARQDVSTIRQVFINRKNEQEKLLSSNGEAGRFFVSFLDNHDLHERFNHPATPVAQVTAALCALFCLQGIPCIYYGTEQGLPGIKDDQGNAIQRKESVREALWGKEPVAFDTTHPLFLHISALSKLRLAYPALRFGRLYFRKVSGNGIDFGHPEGAGGLLAFSRILASQEVLIIINTNISETFHGFVVIDNHLNNDHDAFRLVHSNIGTTGIVRVKTIYNPTIYENHVPGLAASVTTLPADIAPMEAQVFISEK